MQCIDFAFHRIWKQQKAISVDCINSITQNFSYTYVFIISLSILLSSEAICIVTYALVTMSCHPNVVIMLPQSCGREKRYDTILWVHIFHSRTDNHKHKRGGARVSVVTRVLL